MKIKIKSLVLLIALFASAAHFVPAQAKKKSKKKTVSSVERFENNQLPVFRSNEYDFYLTIDKDAKTRLSVQIDSELDMMAIGRDNSLLTDFFSLLSPPKANAKSDKKTPLAKRNVYIKADSSVNFGVIRQTVKSVEKTGMTNFALLVPDEDFQTAVNFVLPPKKPEITVKPNPLTLVVNIEDGGKLELNTEDAGTINDLSKLENFLGRIFKEREENGVFREGTNEVEKTVFVSVSENTDYGKISSLVRSLVKTGASPIGILLDRTRTEEPPPPPTGTFLNK